MAQISQNDHLGAQKTYKPLEPKMYAPVNTSSQFQDGRYTYRERQNDFYTNKPTPVIGEDINRM